MLNSEPWRTAALFARAADAVTYVAARVIELRRAYRHRRDVTLLATFDDRMLADIGLTRGDIRDAVAEPLWRDPSAILSERAAERRGSRRRAAFGLTQGVSSPSIIPSEAFARPATGRPARYTI